MSPSRPSLRLSKSRPAGDRRPGRRRAPRPTEPGRQHRIVEGLILVVAVGAGLGVAGCQQEAPAVSPVSSAAVSADQLAGVSGLGQPATPPWPLPADPSGRAKAAGLTMGPMGMADHYHPELKIIVDGQPVEVPADLGMDGATGQMSALHTHTPDGVIHVEATNAGQVFTLGQLFTEWNVKLAPDQLGALDHGTLNVTVNNTAWTGNPALLRLAADQHITLTYTSTTL